MVYIFTKQRPIFIGINSCNTFSEALKITMKTLESKHKIIESWQLPDDGEKLYPVDAVIEAYVKGKNDGMEQTNKLLKKQFQDNLIKSATNTTKVLEFLNSKGVKGISQHLKAESFDDFSVLITVSEDDILKDVFSEVYKFTEHLEQLVKEELYSISFSFINKSDHFDEEMIHSDGYIFNFVKG